MPSLAEVASGISARVSLIHEAGVNATVDLIEDFQRDPLGTAGRIAPYIAVEAGLTALGMLNASGSSFVSRSASRVMGTAADDLAEWTYRITGNAGPKKNKLLTQKASTRKNRQDMIDAAADDQNVRHVVADSLTRDIIEEAVSGPNAASVLRRAGYDPDLYGGIQAAARKWRNDISNMDANLWVGPAGPNHALGVGISAEKCSVYGINIIGPYAIDPRYLNWVL